METTHNVDNTTIEQEQRSQVDRTWAATLAKCQPQQDAPGRKDAATSNRTQLMYAAQLHSRQLVSAVASANSDILACEEDMIDMEYERIMNVLRIVQMETQNLLANIEAWRIRHLLMEAQQ